MKKTLILTLLTALGAAAETKGTILLDEGGLTVYGQLASSEIIDFAEANHLDLSEMVVTLGSYDQEGNSLALTLQLDKQLTIGAMACNSGTTFIVDSMYKNAGINVAISEYPAWIGALTIIFNPTESWVGTLECDIITSRGEKQEGEDAWGYNLWGNGTLTEENIAEKLPEYLSTFQLKLGQGASNMHIQGDTGFVASGDLVTKDHVGIKLVDYEFYDTSLMVSGLKLYANVEGHTVVTPEPTTGTLSLLALAGLCARRRRK